MTYRYLSSFDRSFKALRQPQQAKAKKALEEVFDFIEKGQRPSGLGLKKLVKDYWEIRVDRSLRLIFQQGHELLTFILVGDHNQIRRFLKTS